MSIPVQDLIADQVHDELKEYESKGYIRPKRSHIDPDRQWKNGAPIYEKADIAYFRGRKKVMPKVQ